MSGLILCCVSVHAQARIDVAAEYWDTDLSGWIDRDAGRMVVSWDSGGFPGGSMKGTFSAQGFPFPEIDAFRADGSSSAGGMTGNWKDDPYRPPYALEFDFLACDELPSDIMLRISGNGMTFFQSLNSQLADVAVWTHVSADLSNPSNWLGGSASEFSNTLASVEWIELQIGRRSGNAQCYGIDNFVRVHQWLPPSATQCEYRSDRFEVLWSELSTNAAYEVQVSTNDMRSWSKTDTLMPTFAVYPWADTNRVQMSRQYYRLILLEP